jgi:hypothetical protein
MDRFLHLLASIAALSGCASRSSHGTQADGMDSEQSFGRSVSTVLVCNDCRPR